MKTYTYKLQGDGRDSWACNDNGNIYMVYEDPDVIHYKELVDERIAIGQKIMRAYLADNAAVNLTFNQSVEQLQKFQVIKAFLEVGNLEDSKIMLSGIAPDDIFTQERKDKYLAMFP